MVFSSGTVLTAAFDRFRQKIDSTSRSVDTNTKHLDRNAKALEGLAARAGTAGANLSVTGNALGIASLFEVWDFQVLPLRRG
jgi:hypothetical protein